VYLEKGMNVIPRLSKTLWVFVFISFPLLAQQRDQILFDSRSGVLVGSKFGPIARLQSALSDALEKCGKPPITADGKLGRGTKRAVMEFQACRLGPRDVKLSQNGEVTARLWHALMPDDPVPTVMERSFVLWLSHEGTDYDRIEWNFGTSDDASALTWGPYGATIGYGNEVRGIFAKVLSEQPGLTEAIFGNETSVLKQLVRQPHNAGYSIVKAVFEDPERRRVWQRMFHALGAQKQVRIAYDWYAFESSEWLKPPLRKLYGLLSEPPTPTEVDFAFFVDLAMHMTISGARIKRAQDALAAARARHALSPGERRRVISNALVPSSQREDRLGRNVVYYVDAVGIEQLRQNEKQAWLAHGHRMSSQCGLSDTEFFPDFLR